MKTRWLILALLLLSSFSSMAARVPRDLKEIPIYQGAVRDTEAEEERRAQYEEFYAGVSDSRRSYTVRVYRVKALIDDVCRFYLDKLGAKPGAPLGDPDSLEPGEIYPPWYELDFWSENFFKDQYEGKTLIHDGKWTKQAFEKRPQWKKGAWLCQAWIEWNIRLDNGDMAQYSVLLEDEGFDSRKKVDYRSTRIRIEIVVTKSEEAWEEEESEAMDEAMAEAMAEKARQLAKNPPTEKTLGVPLYPGAVFSPELTAGMSLGGDYMYYVFFSNDAPEKVVAFYQQKLGKKPLANEGGYIFALKGSLPIPEEGLTVQANMLGGPAKTIITVAKKIR